MNLSTATASVVYTEAVRAMSVRASRTGNITGRIWRKYRVTLVSVQRDTFT